jgi:hypothetical protein
MVVPRSAKKVFKKTIVSCRFVRFFKIIRNISFQITSELDQILYRVVLFRRAADDFRTACREQRFVL